MKKLLILLMMLTGLAGFGKQGNRTISGTVYAKDDKLPIPGVSVMVTDTKTVTTTNGKGVYQIIVPEGSDKLQFSFIGYKTEIIQIGKKEKIDVYLEATTNFLNEVVITNDTDKQKRQTKSAPSLDELLRKMEGMQVGADGQITHQGQAASTSTVITKSLETIQPTTVDQALQGRVPGVYIRGNASAKVRVNGKDYAGGDVQQAIRTLPADILEKIQVIDNYGDQAAKNGVNSQLKSVVIKADTVLYKASPYRVVSNTESYAKLIENKYQNPIDNPLSTFSVDVDNASYSNIRRFINSGQLPPNDAVRIEEMINYFKYQLPEPKDNSPVAIVTELAAAPWNLNHRLLRIGLKARTIPTDKLPASNLVFLIDVSGSMDEPNKLPLVKASMKMLAEQLRAEDRVAIVVYAGNAGLVLPATSGDKKKTIDNAIDNLSAGGSTAGGAGIKLAYKIALENFKKGGNNRIVLATDGDFNVGASSDESMEQLITRERDSGIDLSIMGFGMGNYKDSKMETLADKGNGNYAYIDNLTEAHKALVSEFGGTMFTVAKDVKLQLEFNPAKVQAYRLIGYENRMLNKEDFNNDKKDAGDMGSGHTVTAFYEIVPAGIKDDYAGSVDPLKYQKVAKAPASSSDEVLTVKFRYKEPQGSVSKLSQKTVNDTPMDFEKQSVDYRFATAVAEIGMLLRDSEYKGKASYEQAIKIAKAAKGNDEEGYRSEFIRLAESARLMTKTELAKN